MSTNKITALQAILNILDLYAITIVLLLLYTCVFFKSLYRMIRKILPCS